MFLPKSNEVVNRIKTFVSKSKSLFSIFLLSKGINRVGSSISEYSCSRYLQNRKAFQKGFL
jgi:hypothetical protein